MELSLCITKKSCPENSVSGVVTSLASRLRRRGGKTESQKLGRAPDRTAHCAHSQDEGGKHSSILTHKPPPLTEDPLIADVLWGGKNSFFKRVWPLVGGPNSARGSHIRSMWSAQVGWGREVEGEYNQNKLYKILKKLIKMLHWIKENVFRIHRDILNQCTTLQ